MLTIAFTISVPFTFAQGASVDDFFAQIDAYDRNVVQRAQRNQNTGNPLDTSSYIPRQEQTVESNNSNLVDEEGGRRLALAGSASETSGEYGEVVRYANNQPQYYQASAVYAGSPNMINSGLLLVIFMIILIVMIILRSRKKKKQLMARRNTLYSDGFHDMNRYQPRYYHKAV